MELEVLLLKYKSFALGFLFFSCMMAALFSACNWGLPIFLYNATGVEERAKSPKVLSGQELPK